jgi:GMP synthase-like glutamine amidotransferase
MFADRQDQVLELPPCATLLASSPHCPVEMFAVGETVLTMQGHPEFSNDIVSDLFERLVAAGAVVDTDGGRVCQRWHNSMIFVYLVVHPLIYFLSGCT